MNGYEKNMKINGEVFLAMRTDADRMIQKLLKNMAEKESLKGSVTIKIDIELMPEFIPNYNTSIDAESRRVLTPKITHKVGSVLQIKNEANGSQPCEGSELVWSEKDGEYVLVPITNTAQMSIYDMQPDAADADVPLLVQKPSLVECSDDDYDYEEPDDENQ